MCVRLPDNDLMTVYVKLFTGVSNSFFFPISFQENKEAVEKEKKKHSHKTSKSYSFLLPFISFLIALICFVVLSLQKLIPYINIFFFCLAIVSLIFTLTFAEQKQNKTEKKGPNVTPLVDALTQCIEAVLEKKKK